MKHKRFKQLIEYLLRSLAERPEAVVVTETVQGNKHHYFVEVARSDYSRIIGRGGQTINSIRSIIRAAASKAQIEAIVDVREKR
ncbi:MAG: KH domain-containing protein [Acidobacteriota bacterium]|nr:KH domain-containing protein [Blastocatellia bacterium]MDW8412909.1 KH domain-containing protein [Acidobacteriota bacterium]